MQRLVFSLFLSLTLTAIVPQAEIAPTAAAQACQDIDPHGSVGIYEGRPVVDYIIWECSMTPLGLRYNSSEGDL